MRKNILLTLLLIVLAAAVAEARPPLRMNPDGKFKIVQFTDLHYNANHSAAKEPIELIKETLADEKPDLVVFTGDVVTMQPALEGWDAVLAPVEAAGAEWAVVFGNHDDEKDKSRTEIMEHIMRKPHCRASKGPDNIKGVGNYTLEILAGDSLDFLLYFMDSNAYPAIEGFKGYGWFEFNQIEWYRNLSREYAARNGGRPAKALAFFHIPLNEYAEMTAARKKIVGMKNENECPGAINTGMFAAMRSCGDVTATFVGHDHDNDYIGSHNGIILAYGRFSGAKNTYTHMIHGARIIELSKGERNFQTRIRLRGGSIINKVNSSEL
ncbi:MAG: metallophosphoesterase family protein [Prevotellaceae bacterium]|jgi:predicted phosphodiesterase|nr:metallophosphoesterase family protein [Prevotellaceae bacterium]